MQLIDNINQTLRDDLVATIKSGSRVSIAAASFSIYAFQELKGQLRDIDELRFIFTSPSFITEKADKQRREFYIPRLNRERDLFGSEFEIKLRNELSLKAVAKECAEWIRQKACFKSNRTNENMMGFINVDDVNYMPITGFTTVDLGCERGNNAYQFVQRTDAPMSQFYLNLFNQVWQDGEKLQVVTEQVLDNITNAYKENAPEFIYFVTLYNIFNEFLEDISEDARTAKKALEAWEDICITMEVVGDGLRDFLDKTELRIAVCLAGCYKSTKAMAHRYLHTKKKRTRKKYEKRIRAWFREVFR